MWNDDRTHGVRLLSKRLCLSRVSDLVSRVVLGKVVCEGKIDSGERRSIISAPLVHDSYVLAKTFIL